MIIVMALLSWEYVSPGIRPASCMACMALRRIFSLAGSIPYSHPGGRGTPRYMYVVGGGFSRVFESRRMFSALVSVVLLAVAVATRALAFRSARARPVLYAALSGVTVWYR